MLNIRRVLVGVMAALLVCSVPSAQTPTASSESAELAAVRVKANTGDADAQFFSRQTTINASEYPMSMPVMPLPKNGPCPSGYNTHGNYCVPQSSAKPAILKNGPCPSSWNTYGNYCVSQK